MTSDEQGANGGTERMLVFALDRQRYALRASTISGLADCGTVRKVPGAPPEILGLAEWRGELVTVLNLPRLLGHRPRDTPRRLVRLAPPLDLTALYVTASVRMASVTLPDAIACTEARTGNGQALRLLDPAGLVAQVGGKRA